MEESVKKETRLYIECLEEVKSDFDKLAAQGKAIEEKVDDLALKLKMHQDQTGIN